MSNLKLREVIKQIRQCKTAAEERGVISKESALIRNAFKEKECEHRNRNIAKLLFFNLLGYPVAFGQVECIKLVSAPSYTEKRIGYLGIGQMMDEGSDILMMVTNSIKKDLNAKETYVIALGLTAIAEVSTQEMCRELYPEVKRLMKSKSPYIRQRAALAAIRTVKNIPDTIEDFLDIIKDLVTDKHQSVVMATATFISEILKIEPEYVSHFRQYVNILCKTLKNLIMSGYAPEYEIGGVKDPFLQVKILELLGKLGYESSDASDEMSDVLATIATNTENSKNPGNSVLAECVKTIMNIEASQGLRVLGIGILARFLASKENNVRYVALNQLIKVVDVDYSAVQRHRQTITECLKDHDLVIKKQALDLIYKITNNTNVKTIVKELVNYLLSADAEFKKELSNKICQICEKYAPSKKWHIDTVVKTLCLSEGHVREEYISQVITVIATTPELHTYSVSKVYFSMKENINQVGMVQLGCWLCGEFGEMLVNGTAQDPDGNPLVVPEDEIVEVYEQVLDEHDRRGKRSDVIIGWALTALSKLTIRLKTAQVRVAEICAAYSDHANVEIQQRACEYMKIFEEQWNAERTGIFEPIPFKGDENMLVDNKNRAVKDEEDDVQASPLIAQQPRVEEVKQEAVGGLDLDAILGGETSVTPATEVQNPTSAVGDLMDIFGGSSQSPASTPSVATPSVTSLDDIFGGSSLPVAQPTPVQTQSATDMSSMFTAPQQPQLNYFEAYDDANLKIELSMQRGSAPGEHLIKAWFTNKQMMGASLFQVSMQVAVQKYMRLTLSQISSQEIPAGSSRSITQEMNIVNSQEGSKPLALRLRISYSYNGQQIVETKTINKLPSDY